MSFNNWFDDDEDDFFEQLREMERRISKLMGEQLKEIVDALEGGEMEGEMHIRPIDGPGVKGYVMWGQLGDATSPPRIKRKISKPLLSRKSVREKERQPMLIEESGEEEAEEESAERRKPLVDKFKSKDEYVVLAELPGTDESDVRVEIRNGVLEISGGQKFRTTRIRLPPSAQADRLKRSYKNGILEIRIPRGRRE